jgi:hypothetical protein
MTSTCGDAKAEEKGEEAEWQIRLGGKFHNFGSHKIKSLGHVSSSV